MHSIYHGVQHVIKCWEIHYTNGHYFSNAFFELVHCLNGRAYSYSKKNYFFTFPSFPHFHYSISSITHILLQIGCMLMFKTCPTSIYLFKVFRKTLEKSSSDFFLTLLCYLWTGKYLLGFFPLRIANYFNWNSIILLKQNYFIFKTANPNFYFILSVLHRIQHSVLLCALQHSVLLN